MVRGVVHVRIEYWGRIRVKNGSYYVTIPAAEMYKLKKSLYGDGIKMEPVMLEGKEVRVEVTL